CLWRHLRRVADEPDGFGLRARRRAADQGPRGDRGDGRDGVPPAGQGRGRGLGLLRDRPHRPHQPDHLRRGLAPRTPLGRGDQGHRGQVHLRRRGRQRAAAPGGAMSGKTIVAAVAAALFAAAALPLLFILAETVVQWAPITAGEFEFAYALGAPFALAVALAVAWPSFSFLPD